MRAKTGPYASRKKTPRDPTPVARFPPVILDRDLVRQLCKPSGGFRMYELCSAVILRVQCGIYRFKAQTKKFGQLVPRGLFADSSAAFTTPFNFLR